MFGYVKVEKAALSGCEFGLYHAFFCNQCVAAKEQYGFSSRLLTNFDMAFFNVLFHSYLQKDVEICNSHCITTPIKKRSIVQRTELGDKLCNANIILCYLNLLDDVQDEGRLKKRLALAFMRRYYKKARMLFPELDAALTSDYSALRKLELQNCTDFDIVWHPFAHLSRRFAGIVLEGKADGFMLDLCYNLGKWIYLIDALDDLQKDFRRGSYNPFLRCFGNFVNAQQFVKDNDETLQFIFYSVLNKIAENYNDLELQRYTCILNNVLHRSLRNKTELVFDKYRSGEKENKIESF